MQREDGALIKSTWQLWQQGCIKGARQRSNIHGGTLDTSEHTTRTQPHLHKVWRSLLRRTDGNYQCVKGHKGCTLDPAWKLFPNFVDWAITQKGHDKAGWHLDKDIILQGNKHYSPDTCCFVPARINTSIRKTTNRFGLPTGVRLGSTGRKYVATLDSVYLGVYPTAKEAHKKYQAELKHKLSNLADKYRIELEPRVYKALKDYRGI